MKRNKLMRSASILFALALVTTSLVSGTYAKYTTEDSTSDTARVAKWGVVVSASGNLFSNAYIQKSGGNTPVTWISNNDDTGNTLTVATASIDGENIVAPGTKSESGLTFNITGTPEVRTKVDVTVDAQDIYLKNGVTFATMQPVSVDATSFSSMVATGLYTKDTHYKYTQATGTAADGVTYYKDNQGTALDGGVEIKVGETDVSSYYIKEVDGEAATTYTKLATTATFDINTDYYKLSGKVTIDDTNGYYPVKYSYSNNGTNIVKDTTAKEIALGIAKKLQSGITTTTVKTTAIDSYTGTQTFDPNTDLTGANGVGIGNISWEWVYENTAKTTVKVQLKTGDAAATYNAENKYYKTNTAGDGYEEDTSIDSQEKLTAAINANSVYVDDEVSDKNAVDNTDLKDTILGNLISGSVDVVSVAASTDAVNVLTIDDDGLVKDTSKTEVGSIRTSLDITITATQVD